MIADFCCGIGGDLQALARRGPVIGSRPRPGCRFDGTSQHPGGARRAAADACRFETTPVDAGMPICSEMSAWHIDPDRRPGGSRTTQVKLHDPGPEVLARLLEICPHGAIKLAPAADFVEPWWANAELEWISRRQAMPAIGGLVRAAGRASRLATGDGHSKCKRFFARRRRGFCRRAARGNRLRAEDRPLCVRARPRRFGGEIRGRFGAEI